ncbi:MAG TPA: LPS-assembly protein LptD [Casimicrobiaceae bacterium]|nr:LPS-assembly protein LptD [Casimicrobiaceae bacterium]
MSQVQSGSVSKSVARLHVWASLAVALCAAYPAYADELSLKLARELAPPATKSATVRGPGRAPSAAPATPAAPPVPEPPRGVVFLRADRLEGNEQMVTAEGSVELRSRYETVLADWLSYDMAKDEIWAKGNVVIRRGFDWITGPELRYERDTQLGAFTTPQFFVAEANANGSATEIRFAGPDKYEVTDARYTTCIASNRDWYLTSEELEVDSLRKVATAHRASVYFMDVPVMYAPWLEFPLSNERKSGFLTPTVGITGVRGFEASVPYYLNLAPNYDATIAPRLMTKRGLMIGGQFRYLLGDETSQWGQSVGEANAEILPDDRVTHESRYAFSWKHNQQFTSWLAGFVNLNKVSDDTYFADFADRVAITSQKTLPRDAGLLASSGPWSLLARVQSFQTLQDPNQPPVTPPYNRLPQILGTLGETDWAGLTWSGMTEFASFSQGALTPTGNRFVLYPRVAFERSGAAWFFTARASVHYAQYDLNQTTPPLADSRPSVTVPITSLDAGLVFEREDRIFDTNVVQTLEPRAFYVYIPFRNQSNLPVFDTALDDFSFSSLFTENRYIGQDRVGDANQLTLALTSRFIDPGTGAERLRLAVGQRFYFSDQQVTLSEPPRSAGKSDFLAGADGKLNDVWSLNSLLQYNFDASEVERFNAGVRYTPGPGRALNATWRFTRELVDPTGGIEQIKQIDLSGQWPVSERLTLLGRWNYSLTPPRKTLEAVAGIEYNGDCWVLRVVAQRLTTTTQQTSTSVFLQLELNGLARVGTSPLELLRRSVPGYIPVNDPSLIVRDRTLDPLPGF